MRIQIRYVFATPIAFFALLVTRSDAATSSAAVSVSAVVTASCVIGSSPLSFGNYSGASLDQVATLSVLCTNGTPYTIALDDGTGAGATATQRQMTGPNNQTLTYSLFSDAAHTVNWAATAGVNTVAGAGAGLPQTIRAYGEIPAAQSPAPGSYSDTVTVTLTY